MWKFQIVRVTESFFQASLTQFDKLCLLMCLDRARWRKLIGMIDDYDESSG